MTLTYLQKKHPSVIYRKAEYKTIGNDLRLEFEFELEYGPVFHTIISLKEIGQKVRRVPKELLENLVFHQGLVELISYWKASCSPNIIVEAGNLSFEQITWWKSLFKNGLGEFFYRNGLSQDTVEKTHWKASGSVWSSQKIQMTKRLLTLVGGGKDSAVSIEILKKASASQIAFLVNPTTAMREMVLVSGLKGFISVERKISPELIELNKKGYLNGHIPISATLAFLSLIAAVVERCSLIIVSNERSSDEENAVVNGEKINHQYSKSLDFETAFRTYIHTYISPSIQYVSLLRPLWEVQIAKIFSMFPQYHLVFKSCNQGAKRNCWCGHCPKCLSTYILLYPFLGKKLSGIFGKDLFKNAALFSLLQQLTSPEFEKPFECVGTREEMVVSLYRSIQIARTGGYMPILLQKAEQEILSHEQNLDTRIQKILSGWGEDRYLPQTLKRVLKNMI